MVERYLITGANGFIGSRLAERLTAQPETVVDKVGHDDDYGEKVALLHPDFIYHLAAYGNHSTQIDVRETYEANVWKLMDILEAAKDKPIKGIVNTGTSSEYGFKLGKMNEEDRLEPETFYAASKAAGTLMARVYARQFGEPVVTVRPFSIYGPGEADFRFIPTVIRKLARNETIQLSPFAMHDWTYIDDFIDGMLLVGQKANMLKGKVVNIGTGMQVSNREIVDAISKIMGKEARIEVKEGMRKYDSTNWVADNNVAKRLGWSPKHSLIEGLEKTVEYYLK